MKLSNNEFKYLYSIHKKKSVKHSSFYHFKSNVSKYTNGYYSLNDLVGKLKRLNKS